MIAQLKEHGIHQPASQPDKNHEVNRHPVSELQEYLQQRHISAPAYFFIPHDGGYEHLKEFTCKCTIDELNLQVKERRKNQKIARKAAATQMLKDLLKIKIIDLFSQCRADLKWDNHC